MTGEHDGGVTLISLGTWIRIRSRVDAYFRARALRPGRIRVTGEGSLNVDHEDITSSESSKQAARAAHFLIHAKRRSTASPEDVAVMRRSLDDRTSPTWVGYVARPLEGHLVLELQPEVCESLNWREGDRIGFRRLYSGELLTSIDRRARHEHHR